MLNVQQQQLHAPRTGPQLHSHAQSQSMSIPGVGMGPMQGMGMQMVPGMPVPVPVAAVPPIAHRGTLQPGQVVRVGQYDVTVERYLAEGGYAHVYLVQTPTAIAGQTRHVLKRIACASDAILHEVGTEVQVMKLLRGHANIVQLHAAASAPQADGSSVVYILMEFCAGGGIIDYMNRRLRERLTEGEILQIFVDVCEGVARMHALKPPLLHRDLKIENILQSSSTLYKLCDFGSAAAVTPPPSNLVQLRLLEADLNKHTTLQYRAPEMVDVYQRRPIDTKSDVWALGVLLYKLCYYTTPFEAHGPVAIMTASYKIPSYPVYSPALNGLIAHMLQEHGVNRPSVFEVLDTVHRMRGTKSVYHYDISPTTPALPLRNPSSPTKPSSTKPSSSTAKPAPLAPPASGPPLRSHISGPPPRSGSINLWEDAVVRDGNGNGRPVPAAKPAFVSVSSRPAVQSPALAPPAGASQKPAPPAGSKPSASRPAGSGTIPIPSAFQSPSPSPSFPFTTTTTTANALSPPLSIPQPQPQPQTRARPTSAYLSPSFLSPASPSSPASSLSAEERFPAIDVLSSSLDQAFSPPLLSPGADRDRDRPVLSRRTTPSAASQRTSPLPTPAREKAEPSWARRSPSPTKSKPAPTPAAAAASTLPPFHPVSSRSTGVRGSAMLDRPVFSPPAAALGGTGTGTGTGTGASLAARAVYIGRAASAEPGQPVPVAAVAAAAAPHKPAPAPAPPAAKLTLPERTNPPMKRLESDFAKPKPRKRQRRRTADDEEEEDAPVLVRAPAPAPASAQQSRKEKEQEQAEQEAKRAKPRDWLTGDGSWDANDRTLVLGHALVQPTPAVQAKPVAATQLSKPAASASAPARAFVRSPSPVREAAVLGSRPAPVGSSGAIASASAFKRHSVAVTYPAAGTASGMPSAADGAPARANFPPRPQSGIFTPPTLKSISSPKPKEKPTFLRDADKPASSFGPSLKLDTNTSPRKPPPTLTDNWSPVESTFPRRSTSSDEEGPEDPNGGGIRDLRRQFEPPKPKPVPAPKPATTRPVGRPVVAPSSPVKGATQKPAEVGSAEDFVSRFPDLTALSSGEPRPLESQRTPVPSPNTLPSQKSAPPLVSKPNISRTPGPTPIAANGTDLPPTNPRLRPSPVPSPNIMDEANEELPGSLAARMSAFTSRQPPKPAALPAGAAAPRPRPQSMFLSSSMIQTMSSLQLPLDTTPAATERRTPRRGSISEMVSKYEALNSPVLSTTGQRSPTKETPPASSQGAPVDVQVERLTRPAANQTPDGASQSAKPTPRPEIVQKDIPLALPSSTSNSSLARRRTVAAAPSQGIASAFGPPKAQIGLPGLAKLPSLPERSPSVPMRQNSAVVEGDYKPRALPGLAKSPSYLSTPAVTAQPAPKAASPAQAGLPARAVSPIGTPLPTPKPSPATTKPAVAPQPTSNAKATGTTSIVSPTPRRADPSPGPPSATAEGVDTAFQGVGKLVAQWQQKAEESAQSRNTDKKQPSWQRLR